MDLTVKLSMNPGWIAYIVKSDATEVCLTLHPITRNNELIKSSKEAN